MAEPILLKFLTPEELDAIHTATLRILNEIGVVLTHPGAREILTGSGAVVEGTHLRLPPELVESALANCTISTVRDSVSLRG